MIAFRSDDDRREILEALQENMNEEFRATLQYVCHRISAQSVDPVLADSFKSAALDEMAHILFFSDLISKHGGVPAFTNWEIDTSLDIPAMLERDVQLERSARERYSRQLERVQAYPELVQLLETVREDEEDHERLFSRYLEEVRKSPA